VPEQDIAIKKVLQDKRFKVSLTPFLAGCKSLGTDLGRTENSKSCDS
jgi:hypothetical protein